MATSHSSLKGDVALKKIVIHVQGEDAMLWQYNDSTFPFEIKPGALHVSSYKVNIT
jgi:hypothetical protein